MEHVWKKKERGKVLEIKNKQPHNFEKVFGHYVIQISNLKIELRKQKIQFKKTHGLMEAHFEK